MRQVRLVMIDYPDVGIDEYLLTVKGISEVNVNDKEIVVNYDSKLISLKVIKLEIYLFLGIKNPGILMFDKNSSDRLEEDDYLIKDACCEMCLLYKIDELMEVPGIEKVETDYDMHYYYDIKLKIRYNQDKIKWNEICRILAD